MKKSTKRKKKAEAMEEALRLEKLARGGAEVMGEQGAKAYEILEEAAEAAARGELSEGRARQLIAKLCEVSTGRELLFYTVRSWSEDWLAGKRAMAKRATVARYEASVRVFLAYLGERADSRLEAVTKADIRGFRDALREGWTPDAGDDPEQKTAPRSARTVNHYVADVGGMFRAAVREGLLLASPASAVEKLPELDSVKRETFDFAEVAKLVETAGRVEWLDRVFPARNRRMEAAERRCRDWQGVTLVGFYGGLRLGDAARLKRSNVDMARKVLSFLPAKTERKGRRLEAPMHPRLVAFFEEHGLPDEPDAPVFPSVAKTSVSGKQGLSSQFLAIMAEADIDRRTAREGEGGRRAVHARSFHALRHSLTSALANADVPEEIRRRIIGHESQEVHALYTHHETETLARAVEKLPTI